MIIAVILVGLTAGIAGAYIAVHNATITIYPYKAVFEKDPDMQVVSGPTEIAESGDTGTNTGSQSNPLTLDNDTTYWGAYSATGENVSTVGNYIYRFDFEEQSVGSAPTDTTWKIEVYIDDALDTTFWVQTPSTKFANQKGGIRLTVKLEHPLRPA